MAVRHEHGVDPAGIGGRRAGSEQVRDPAPQQGIGQEPDAVELDEDGRVPEVGDPPGDQVIV